MLNLLFNICILEKLFTGFKSNKNTYKYDLENDKAQFHKVARFTVGLAEDIYCNTLSESTCGDNYFKFLTHERYTKQGKEVQRVNADAQILMPKCLVYDWNGKEILHVPKTRVIAIRGTHSTEEWAGNFDAEEVPGSSISMKCHGKKLDFEVEGYFHQNFAKTALKLYCEIEDSIKNSQYPIIVTGHSRGAALAELMTVLIKKKTNKEVYCFAYAPPPSMALETTSRSASLTDTIYGFSCGLDPIPHIFVPNLMKPLGKVVGIIDVGKALCPIAFEQSTCDTIKDVSTALLYTAFNIIRPVVFEKSKTTALEGFKQKIDTLKKIIKKYQDDPDSFKIRTHVGNFYQLEWREVTGLNERSGLSLSFDLARASDPTKIRKIDSVQTLTTMKKIGDHQPYYYRYAVYDDKVSNCNQFSCWSVEKKNERAIIRRLNAEKPSWVPEFPADDNSISDDMVSWDHTEKSTYYSFGWYSAKEDAYCSGRSTEKSLTNFDNIIYLFCQLKDKNDNKILCKYNASLTEQEQCIPYLKPERSQDNRCNAADDEGCQYYSKYSHNKKSTSKSSNTYQKCEVEGSCTSSQKSAPVKLLYLGSNSLYNIKPADYLLRAGRKILGNMMFEPALQHPALFVELIGQEEGIVIAYGEYDTFKYENYLNCDGVRVTRMTLDDFKKEYTAFNLKEMGLQYNMTAGALLEEMKTMKGWRAKNYNFWDHNCQDFIAEVIKHFNLVRKNISETDDYDIPYKILTSLNYNERKFTIPKF